MSLPNFHDGYFDGFLVDANKGARLFLRAWNQQQYTLLMRSVVRLSISDVKEGNIIFDVVLREAHSITSSDIHDLYGVEEGSEPCARILESVRQARLQILELNSSYGANGLFLFETFEVLEGTYQSAL
jgi:hypothetical protein